MKRAVVLLSLGVFLVVSCEKKEQEIQVSNVSFTPCKQSELRSSSELSSEVDVEFTNGGVQIKHYNFGVHCDFTTVNVTHTFVNGVLDITQKCDGNARCMCYTDVSYTISGISQNQVNVIFINGVQVYCHNDDNDKFVNATVLGIGGDCRLLLIKFDEEVAGLVKSPVPNVYYAYNIPKEFQTEGKRIEVQLGQFPESFEFTACTTMGPTYPAVYVIKVK